MPSKAQPFFHQSLHIGEHHLLMDLIPVSAESKKTLVILNDRTETMRLAEELSGVKHILEALRTTTHENRNKMHVIYGLLQTGATADAITFISDSVSEDEDNLTITEAIRDKTVAALIIGKKRRAKELRIDFRLLKGSHLEESNPFLPSLAKGAVKQKKKRKCFHENTMTPSNNHRKAPHRFVRGFWRYGYPSV